jgi:hypothetical protein
VCGVWFTGIGKSIFMGQFYHQIYSEKYPRAKILLASYNRKSILTNVVVMTEGRVIREESEDSAKMGTILGEHKRDPGKHNIRLLDGSFTLCVGFRLQVRMKTR